MIWYFVIGAVYVFIRFKEFQKTLAKAKEEYIVPEIIVWFIILVTIVLWPVALLLDFSRRGER